MEKTPEELWNGWFVFGDLLPLLPTPCGEHCWPSVQHPFCSFFLSSFLTDPTFVEEFTSPLHDPREDGPIPSQEQIVTSIVHCGNFISFASDWYRRGHLTQFCPVKNEERCSGGSCFYSGCFHGWMRQVELQLPPCTSLRTTREEAGEQLSPQDLCLMFLHL